MYMYMYTLYLYRSSLSGDVFNSKRINDQLQKHILHPISIVKMRNPLNY